MRRDWCKPFAVPRCELLQRLRKAVYSLWQLADASGTRHRKIARASAAVNQMAVSMTRFVLNAAESSAVAETLGCHRQKKAPTWCRTHPRPWTIFSEQIQEPPSVSSRLASHPRKSATSCRDQDIADQTNIPVAKRRIQASMAGMPAVVCRSCRRRQRLG